MLHPALALLCLAVMLAVAWLLFWPGVGLVPLVRRSLLVGERERIEDALKHLHDCEYIDTVASIHSLAGALNLSTSRVARLTQRLESLGLMRVESNGTASDTRRSSLRVAHHSHSSIVGSLFGRSNWIQRGRVAWGSRPP